MRTLNNTLRQLVALRTKLGWPAAYFAVILLSNLLMVWLPMMPVAGTSIPPAILVFGLVFILRDLAQRAVGHLILPVMAAAALATYGLAGPAIAAASVTAFVISEIADWAVFTATRRPLKQRILLSSLVAVPVDTAVFFLALGILDPHSLAVGVVAKLLATFLIWLALSVGSGRRIAA